MTLFSHNSLISHQESLAEMAATHLPALKKSDMQKAESIDVVTQNDANREAIDG